MKIMDEARLADTVRHILLAEWDPIRLQELPAGMREANSDEYDRYVQPIVQMIMDDKEEDAFRDYLRNIETHKMGQKPQFSRASLAAKALFELKRRA
jgi:hypothetical protein